LKAWPILGVTFVEAVLLLAHWFIYHTVIVFMAGDLGPGATLFAMDALSALAFSFIVAALLSFRFSNLAVNALYKIAAVWLGFLNYFFFAACLCWLTWFGCVAAGLRADRHRLAIAVVLFIVAIMTGLYGLLNTRWIRIRRVRIQLANLPASWNGRTALLFSDLHLGHVNGLRFSRRIANLAARLQPDIILIPGDLFDGVKCDPDRLTAPFKQLAPPYGIYFSTGNHDEFGGAAQYSDALTRAGIRVLANEKVIVDGLQILGVPYHDTTYPIRMKATLEALHIDRGQASILLNHAPIRLPIVEKAGISLQLSGHTHGGQLFPFTWLTRRVFGEFTHGLHTFGALQVCTSFGAGTWGPPMRVGTSPEIVLLQFE
jgi:predicted MPP superfamily phosphohydrolase